MLRKNNAKITIRRKKCNGKPNIRCIFVIWRFKVFVFDKNTIHIFLIKLDMNFDYLFRSSYMPV